MNGHCVGPTNPFVEFKKTEVEQSIADRFEQQVAKYPERLAVKSKHQELTYDALNNAANRVARAILAREAAKDQPIAILVDHDAALLASILGILKSGNIFVPLDPYFPRKRNHYVIEDSGAGTIVTDEKNSSSAALLSQNRHCVINIDEIDSGSVFENPCRAIPPNSSAYILYTSGSTGQPKGVIQTQRNALHDTMQFTNALHIQQSDRINLFYSCSARSLRGIFGALLNGASLHFFKLKEEGIINLADWLIQEEISLYHSVPSVFRQLASTLSGKEKFPALRLIRLGGERVLAADVQCYKAHFSDRCIMSIGMGTTETGTYRQYFVDQTTPISGSVVPSGYPVPDMEVLILNDDKVQVDSGVMGEVAIRSPYLTPGYWRKPHLNESSFLPGNPPIYLTGDLGRLLPDDCLEHLGRTDFQAKIRGFRIEPPEIEKILLEHSGIKEAIVLAREDRLDEKRLVAYVVARQQPAPTLRELRNFLQQKLPDYMIPSAFVFLPALPLTPNGKVDRLALPAPSRERPQTEVHFVVPRKGVEHELAQIWEELLGLEHLGIHDNFFDLGGHSLLAARMFSEIQKRFGKKLPLSTLFQGATIHYLAGIIGEPKSAQSSPSLVAIQPQGSRPPFFCVHDLLGDVLCYRKLAHYLGRNQPFYGLRARGLEGAEEPLKEIATMASYYIEAIQTVQPQGPYFLGGLSFGGVVAFEMACQLEAQGHRAALVALLDSPAPASGQASGTRVNVFHNFLRDLPDWLIGLLQLTSEQRRELFQFKLKMTNARMNDILGLRDENKGPNLTQYVGDLSEFPPQHREIARIQYQAFREYNPRVYAGCLTLLRDLMQPLFSAHDPDNGWKRLAAGELDIKVIPGNHLGMLQEPHVRVLAEQLRTCLDDAQSEMSK